MCLILLALQKHPFYKLIVAANRDEYYDRPSASPTFWNEAPAVLAGRDLKGGGTWLGITRKGRIAAVTNYRDPASVKINAPSRGLLVKEFLLSQENPVEYLRRIHREREKYNGFNIVLGQRDELFWYSNRCGEIPKLSPGVYGISNRLLDTPWAKIIKSKQRMNELLTNHQDTLPENLFQLLHDRTPASDDMLPDTGVGITWERLLSPIFIASPTYGTRSSTLIFIDRNDRVDFMDRAFDGHTEPVSTRFQFTLEP